MRNNYANYTQTLHLTLHLSDFPSVTKCIVYALNYTQTIHWGVSNPTQKLYTKAYTATRTLHKNYTWKPTPQLYILFFKHESNESNGWSEWSVRNESDVCDVRNERDVCYVRNERTGETKGRAGDGLVTGWWRVGDGVNGTSPRCHGSRISSFHLRAHPFWNINVHEFDSLKSH